MKKLKHITILFLLAFATLQAGSLNITEAFGGYFDVYLKNNCSKEIEVRVRADGSSSVSKYKAGDKQKVAVKEGYEIYVDGKLYLKLKDADSGKEISLCK